MTLLEGEEVLLRNAGYSEKIIQIYSEAPNVGFIENPSVTLDYKGKCGDIIKFYLIINQNNVIEEAKFQYIGCPALAASGSILTEMVKKKSLQDVKKITEDEVRIKIGGLPDAECHCAKLAVAALNKTIAKYMEDAQIVLEEIEFEWGIYGKKAGN
jgi:nitrogen fixation NifU-like protein